MYDRSLSWFVGDKLTIEIDYENKNGKEEKMYNNSFMSINNHQFTSKKTYDREI